MDAVAFRFRHYFLRPQRALNLPDVGFSQEEHTDTGLADAAADGVGQLFFNNSPVSYTHLDVYKRQSRGLQGRGKAAG